jgi:hypothetical protein
MWGLIEANPIVKTYKIIIIIIIIIIINPIVKLYLFILEINKKIILWILHNNLSFLIEIVL